MLNTCVLIGRWAKQVEMRFTSSGKAVATGDLAVNDGDSVDFLPVVMWEKQAENTVNYCGEKGRLVAVQGKIKTRTYETQEGQKRKVTEIVASQVKFLDRGNDQQAPQQNNGGNGETEFDPFAD